MDTFSLHILTTSWPLSPPSAGASPVEEHSASSSAVLSTARLTPCGHHG